MHTQGKLASSSPFAVTVAMFCLCTAWPALANEPSDQDKDTTSSEPAKLELVEVIGYRLKRLDIEGPAPVDVYDREAIANTGAANLAEFFRTLPQVLGQSSDLNQTSGLAGADYINLRGIGIDSWQGLGHLHNPVGLFKNRGQFQLL